MKRGGGGRRAVFVAPACALALSFAQAPLPTSMPGLPAHFLEGRLVELTNVERSRAGVPPVAPSAVLAEAARHHAEEMVRLAYFSHVSPTAGRASQGDRVALMGGTVVGVGENIATVTSGGLDFAERVIAGWMQSPGHRENLLGPHWTHVGFGLHEGRDGGTAVVQVFAADPNPMVYANAAWGPGASLALRFEVVSESPGWVLMAAADAGGTSAAVAAGEPVTLVLERVDATAPTHLRLGWTSDRAAGFIGQESGWFDPASGRWTLDWRSDRAVTRVARYEPTPASRDVVVQLAFERAAADLVVFVDGSPTAASVTGTNLFLTVSGRDGVRHVEVGDRTGDGRVRVLHAFEVVVRGDGIELRAGTHQAAP